MSEDYRPDYVVGISVIGKSYNEIALHSKWVNFAQHHMAIVSVIENAACQGRSFVHVSSEGITWQRELREMGFTVIENSAANYNITWHHGEKCNDAQLTKLIIFIVGLVSGIGFMLLIDYLVHY